MELFDSRSASTLSATQVVEAYFSAFARGDIHDVITLLDDDVVWHIDGNLNVSTVGILQGPAQVKHWLESFPHNFQPREFTVAELIEHNDSVLALGRFRHTV
ncbi:MAG: nuclear transport factor 2 family protein [Serratia inhibens]|uniref:nuclear transport factor 2 family protein n=1 Tax=Serratia inhibens TaxID=2338073 RepID=UPI003C7D19CD